MESPNRINNVGVIAFVVAGLVLLAGFHFCYGDPPPLSIARSNSMVTLSWSATTNVWQLVATVQWFDRVDSNGDQLVGGTERIRPFTNGIFNTNGSNISVTMPIDPSVSQIWFFLEPANSTPPPPL